MRKAESTLGVRYSVLLSLPYFDPVRFTVVDVMHNLFLGTGKYMFKIWLSMELLTKESLQEMERRISSFTVPNSLGRLPINISSNHGGYTSSQWQSWITLYSPVVLKGLLPNAHYQCWLLFVRACSILSRRIIKDSEVATADLLLLNFCKKFELLYMERTTALRIFICTSISKTVYLTMGHHMHCGVTLLKGIMECLAPTIRIENQLKVR